MTHGQKLIAALSSVDWRSNVDAFGSLPDLTERLAKINYRLALWSGELETVDRGNFALGFIREAQTAGHHVACLMALALYKPGAASMRSIVDCVLQYSYFRVHPSELATLRRDERFFMDKKTILDYHRQHTDGFTEKQQALGLISRLDAWYSKTSAIIHGQEPGKWVTHRKVEEISFSKEVCELGIAEFEEAGQIVNRILLCTMEEADWRKVNQERKREFLKGLKGKEKNALGLTIA